MRAAKDMLKRRPAALGSACERGGKMLFLTCVVVLSLAISSPACAQMMFIEDAGPHAILGAKAAAGAVVWTHGRSVEVEDSLTPTPTYLEAFRAQRWDAYRLNRMRAGDSLGAGSQALAGFAAGLKAEGYRRVVLVGQSFGAFISLIAADITDEIDAVVAVAPAAYGPVTDNPRRGALNASRLYPVLERIRSARAMLFYFAHDIFDPGGRGPRSEQILSERRQPHLIVDRPPSLKTHWAGSTEEFAERFGPCIVAFASNDAGTAPACRAAERVQAANPRTAPPVGVQSSIGISHAMTGSSGGSRKR